MWLAIDIGNTNIHIGIFEENVLQSVYTLKSEYPPQANFATALNPTTLRKAQAVVLASVNPKAEAFFLECIQEHLQVKPQYIGKDIPIPIQILTEYPEKVGVDRLINAIAAFERTKNWTIVVDAGTAITIDGINDKGAFLGGVIAPGVDTSSKALRHYTALLPQVCISKPKTVLGKNTEEAINSGIYWGTIGMVNKLIELIRDELKSQPAVIATGGNANMLAHEIPLITDVFPHLTLEGIKIAYKTNLASRIPH
jgi:type III pantothenate kinase